MSFLSRFKKSIKDGAVIRDDVHNLRDEIDYLRDELHEELGGVNRKLDELRVALERLMRSVKIDGSALDSGERQVSSKLDGIRYDHLGRYEFVLNYIKNNDLVLDLACGTGYGSYLMAQFNRNIKVDGVDISSDAIDFANKHYWQDNIHYFCCDAFEFSSLSVPARKKYSKIVSFETIEHIPDDVKLLNMFHDLLLEDGLLFLSTPNQELMPFDKIKFPYHFKHYRSEELQKLLVSCGFNIKSVYSQKTNTDRALVSGWNGVFNVVVCEKS